MNTNNKSKRYRRGKKRFATGRKATAICDRTGFKHILKDLLKEPGTNILVYKTWSDRDYNRVDHPQNYPADTSESIALRNPRPDPLSEGTVDLIEVSGEIALSPNRLPYFQETGKTMLGEVFVP